MISYFLEGDDDDNADDGGGGVFFFFLEIKFHFMNEGFRPVK